MESKELIKRRGIPSAEKAREQALSVNNDKNAKELELCEKAISEAIREGKTSAHVYAWIGTPAADHLRKLGYTVTSGSDRNESYTLISFNQLQIGDE
jgi:hypothetical protein